MFRVFKIENPVQNPLAERTRKLQKQTCVLLKVIFVYSFARISLSLKSFSKICSGTYIRKALLRVSAWTDFRLRAQEMRSACKTEANFSLTGPSPVLFLKGSSWFLQSENFRRLRFSDQCFLFTSCLRMIQNTCRQLFRSISTKLQIFAWNRASRWYR